MHRLVEQSKRLSVSEPGPRPDGTEDDSLATRDTTNSRPRRLRAPAVTRWERWLIRRVLALMGNPPLAFELWNGEEIHGGGAPPIAWIHVSDRSTLVRLVVDPYFQFGEAYSEGRLEVEGDVAELLLAIDHAGADSRGGVALGLISRWLRRPRGTTLTTSRKNIHHHYDIGTEFYKLWLDKELAYTCAYFPSPEASLEEAQLAKFEHVCRKVNLRPNEEVVEAGCGWGGLALYMARRYGVRVKAYNISREQILYARRCAEDEGLADRAEFIEDDWRNIRGRFDAFVSVGMLEHVGRRNYLRLGEVIHRCLLPHGRGLLHSIGRNKPQPLDPWIERRIFPGAYPPSLCEMLKVLEPRGFTVHDVENLGRHYVATVRHWLDRFENSLARIADMYDERFVRMWRLYLAGSMTAFTTGSLQLFQVVFEKGRSDRIPLTRRGLYVNTDRAEELPIPTRVAEA